MGLPSKNKLSLSFRALAALLGSQNLQNPTPFGLPVSLSWTILVDSISPYLLK
jgi:hypothetical protein